MSFDVHKINIINRIAFKLLKILMTIGQYNLIQRSSLSYKTKFCIIKTPQRYKKNYFRTKSAKTQKKRKKLMYKSQIKLVFTVDDKEFNLKYVSCQIDDKAFFEFCLFSKGKSLIFHMVMRKVIKIFKLYNKKKMLEQLANSEPHIKLY